MTATSSRMLRHTRARPGGVSSRWDAALIFFSAVSLFLPHGLLIPLWAIVAFLLAGWLWASRADAGTRQVMAATVLLCLVGLIPVNLLGLTAPDVLVFALAVGILTFSMTRFRQVALPVGTFGVTALCVVWFCTTALQAELVQILVRSATVLLPLAAVFVAAGQMHMSVRTRVVNFFIIFASFQAVVAVVESELGPEAPWRTNNNYRGLDMTSPLIPTLQRVEGTFGHPLILSLVLLMAMGFLASRFGWLPLAFRGPLGLLLLTGVVLSGTRSAAAMGVVLMLLVIVSDRSTPRYLLVTSGVLVASPFIFESNYMQQVLGRLTSSGSVSHRLESWDAFGKLIFEQPFMRVLLGNGLDSTARLFDEGLLQTSTFTVIDNQIVTALAHGGIVAMLLLVGLMLGAILRADLRDLPAVVIIASQFFLFDLSTWPATTVLMALALAWGLNPRTEIGGANTWSRRLTPAAIKGADRGWGQESRHDSLKRDKWEIS